MALLGSRATPETVELVRHVLRATNPVGYMPLARFGVNDPSALDFAVELALPVLPSHGTKDLA